MDFNNVGELLRSGVSADTIAQEFTKELNNAIDAARTKTAYEKACATLAEAWRNACKLRGIKNEYSQMTGKDFEGALELFASFDDILDKVVSAKSTSEKNLKELIDDLLR